MGGSGDTIPPPVVKLAESEDNAVDKLCAARFELYPITADLVEFWGREKAKYEVIQPEFGARVRGVLNRVPKLTWEAAHDRRRATELKHWSSQNYHLFKQDPVRKFVFFLLVSC